MATAVLQVPPSNYQVPGSHALEQVTYPEPLATPSSDPDAAAIKWTSSFNALLQAGSSDVSALFLKDSYWRDLLCLSWDFHTFHGPEKVASIITRQTKVWRIKSLNVDKSSEVGKPQISPFDFEGKVKGVQFFVTVDTDVGTGRGVARLLQDATDQGRWKIFTLYTVLQELTGHEERTGRRRPTGHETGALPGRPNWKERRLVEENFEEGLEPDVLVVGVGQGGLSVAARLNQLGMRNLVIDRNARIGDNWRNRYHQLVLHDSIWFDHLPYLNFPSNFPIFAPKDKLAEWFEFYANVMELNVWCKTTVKKSKWDDDSRSWTVTLEREKDGHRETRTLHPRHIIQATGVSGEAELPRIEGVNDFRGDHLIHSSLFQSPKKKVAGKKAVVIGSSNSAHDIAQVYYEHGYDITMIQRSSTHVITSDTFVDVALKALYSEDGPPLEDADLIQFSLPNPVLKRFLIDATRETTRRDAPLLRGLTDAGFRLDNGPDSSGLWMKYLHRGGGYYIDVGASQLIVDGKIKVKQGQEISRINAHSITLANGEELQADEIVFATGYGNMRDSARRIFGDELADRVNDVWGFDEEGETRTMWRRTGHPGFWFFGGNLALCRYYSRLLALQIKALDMGIMKYEDP